MLFISIIHINVAFDLLFYSYQSYALVDGYDYTFRDNVSHNKCDAIFVNFHTHNVML